jgi:predicted RNA-binding protein YlxR (DUF448 family)
MIRLVLGDDGALAVDLLGRSFGRGAWVHPRPDCLARAARTGAAKGLKAPVKTDPRTLVASVRAAADRRVEGLLSSARGAGRIAAGSDAARTACETGEAKLLLVAADARASADAGFVRVASSRGMAMVWGDKERLGRAVARPETALVAILEKGLADSVVRAVALSAMPEPELSVGADQVVSEVR